MITDRNIYVIAMGYMGTGSSAINHLLSEYQNTHIACREGYEHVLLYMPHGLFDLENVLLNNNMMFRSDAAINDFYTAMKKLNDGCHWWFGSYKKIYGKHFMEIVDEFLEGLIQFTREGANWFNDYEYKFIMKEAVKDRIRVLLGRNVCDCGYRSVIKGDNRINFTFVNSEEFYKLAKVFVLKYLKLTSNENDGIILFDQLLKPQNLYRFEKYFNDDVRCIVFNRDVRDMYISSKYVWPRFTGRIILPADSISFVDFYTRFLATEKFYEDWRVLRLNFEDLVYKYDDTINHIEYFIGKENLGKHMSPKSRFNPEVSIKNTQVFRIKKEYEKEVEYIEKNMSSYLYDFPYIVRPKMEETSDPV